MISQGLHISFILLSLILGYQDIQSRTVIAWMYGLTILLGMGYIYTLDIPLSMDHFVSITSFLCVILMITWYKKQPVIAVADILYMILLLYVLESLWTVFFIVLGLSAL
ncbi:MAG: hypothetical protein Q8K36_03615, partial [Alphaproteobacteria bacterium]|nr:hypothetical protein [Alphaproteobacteria bacterium]